MIMVVDLSAHKEHPESRLSLAKTLSSEHRPLRTNVNDSCFPSSGNVSAQIDIAYALLHANSEKYPTC